jgi:hypothetical protein
MSSSKIMACKGTLRQVFICLRPRTPYPLPTPALCTCIQYAYPELTLLRSYGDLAEMKLDYSITTEVKFLKKIAYQQAFTVE